MPDAPSATLCPVLVADLAEPSARDVLLGIALANRAAYVPLSTAPVDGARHVVEVYTPGTEEPLVLGAEPLGPPTAKGFPLRLSMTGDAAAPSGARSKAGVEMPSVEPRRTTAMTLTERHTRDLSGPHAPRSPEALVGRTVASGKLTIEELIGAGGAGAVYRAVHRELRMPVAVKILHESFQRDIEFCRRFHAEALAASRLDHVNVVRVLDYGQEPDGLLYIAMEFLHGTPLSKVIERERALPLPRIVDVMSQVCAALAHAHARGIVHRDVKPDNVVLVCARDDDDRSLERVKVCDFGIAVREHDEHGAMRVAGTPCYMSPEQCRGEALDGRSDVYACGVVLYELATGQPPFDGGDVVSIVNRHMHAAPLDPSLVNPDVDPRLSAIILKALAKVPGDRQPSMRELRQELRALLEPRGAPAGEPVPEWLEHGSSVHARVPPPVRPSPELSAKLGAWLARFADTPDAREFSAMATELEAALPALVARRDVRALLAIHATLAMVGGQAARLSNGAERARRVKALAHAFADPALLAALAGAALAEDDREAERLLLELGTPAAYALYSARLKLAGDVTARRRFIEIVHALDAAALPMIRAGLARLAPHHEAAVARELALDLVLAVPNLADDDAGELVARWARLGPIVLTRAAVPALVKLWGERARPLFLAALASDDLLLARAAAAALDRVGGGGEVRRARSA